MRKTIVKTVLILCCVFTAILLLSMDRQKEEDSTDQSLTSVGNLTIHVTETRVTDETPSWEEVIAEMDPENGMEADTDDRLQQLEENVSDGMDRILDGLK